MNEILMPAAVLGGTGLAMGLFLAFAAKAFEVVKNPKIEEITACLPGANCGGCGFAGCGGYASAIVEQGAPMNKCAPGGAAVAQKIGDIMGASVDVSAEKKVARVICHGTEAVKKYSFTGCIGTCADLALYAGGDKSCKYACLGQGDCVRVCPVDAITINDGGIAEINEDVCIACGQCITACPKSVIRLTDAKKKVTVFCSSKDIGAIARKNCPTACIACGMCVKACPKQAITIENNLAYIDPAICVNCGICATKCPTHAIVNYFKRPTPAAKAPVTPQPQPAAAPAQA